MNRLNTMTPVVGALALVAALVMTGCASPGAPIPVQAALLPAQLGLQADTGALAAGDGWWKALGDPALDTLVERATADHPSVQAAMARLARAQAASQGTQAGDAPQIGLSADATRQRYTANGLVPPPIAGSTRDTGNLQIGGAWSLDFFGRHRAALAAAVGQEQALQAELSAARQALAGA
ncbi:TolC family protein, partial [Sphaerotilus sp.]|uniref:TolC family protein n=1 Tax=Sphaerotilus sp. TaxID=2093942 RepID=UPI0034E1BD37